MDTTARFWDRIAQHYAAKPVADETAYAHKLEVTRRYLHADAEVLELGCGTGSTAIAHASYAARIHATDLSSRMIEIARAKAEAAGIRNVSFECVSADAVELPEAGLDAVLALSLLHLVPDWRGLVRRAHGALRDGGVLVTTTNCLSERHGFLRPIAPLGHALGLLPRLAFFTRTTLEAAMVEAGFELAYTWQPGPGKSVFVVARKPEGDA